MLLFAVIKPGLEITGKTQFLKFKEACRNGTSGMLNSQRHIKGQWVKKSFKMFLLVSQECSVPDPTAVPPHTLWGKAPAHLCTAGGRGAHPRQSSGQVENEHL